ncbi:hypothetical protein Acsp06_62840 [Actinomycetospora sp. NBRC 106375]|uniref:hypothetical protein n=1 Tax=Actinomycetospora sp. NBRC 106375 TaxID=3032207 RepID=UPI0024A36BCF|nr:hypothetical protein [Actinomycetospora sp. NBRC 106375]GLZ50099.1 hypothetical protein Acsp06_62840 [Actinomycetospora sp. NBRC 106375]
MPPQPAPASSGRGYLSVIALTALFCVGAAVLVPWPGTGPWVASSPVGLVLLGGLTLLTAPVTVDLLTGRDRATVMLLGLPLTAAAAAGTVVLSGGDLPGVLATQGVGAGRGTAAGVLAAALLACLLVGSMGAARRPRSARAPDGSAIIVGLCAAISVAAVSTVVITLAGPAPESATVASATGATSTAATGPTAGNGTTPATGTPSSGTAEGSGTAGGSGTTCPTEAASSLPEAAVGAPVVAHSSGVHIAICQGTSGALYYFGANDRTGLTITLPVTRSEDSWIATNNGVTYSITSENLIISRGADTLADEALTSGWPR